MLVDFVRSATRGVYEAPVRADSFDFVTDELVDGPVGFLAGGVTVGYYFAAVTEFERVCAGGGVIAVEAFFKRG